MTQKGAPTRKRTRALDRHRTTIAAMPSWWRQADTTGDNNQRVQCGRLAESRFGSWPVGIKGARAIVGRLWQTKRQREQAKHPHQALSQWRHHCELG